MIDFYCVPTSNGQKIAILLCELGLEFNLIKVNRVAGEPPSDTYLKINPIGNIFYIQRFIGNKNDSEFSDVRILISNHKVVCGMKRTSKKSPRAKPFLLISEVKPFILKGISVSLLLDDSLAKRSSYSS